MSLRAVLRCRYRRRSGHSLGQSKC